MKIRTTTTMLKAIDNYEKSNQSYLTDRKTKLQLGANNNYIVSVCRGEVSVIRDLSKLSAVGRFSNAVIDFFRRSWTKGESGFTCRAAQIHMELQRRIRKHNLEIRPLFSESLPAKDILTTTFSVPLQVKDIPTTAGLVEKGQNAAQSIHAEISKPASVNNRVFTSEESVNHYLVGEAMYATINKVPKYLRLTENNIVNSTEKIQDKKLYLAILELVMKMDGSGGGYGNNDVGTDNLTVLLQ